MIKYNRLPIGYQRLESITGDINLSFVDTGIPYSSDLKIECELEDNGWGSYAAYFGAYVNEQSPAFRLIYQGSNNNGGYFTVGSIASSSVAVNGLTPSTKHHIVLDKTGITLDGTFKANTSSTSSASISNTILIGRPNLPSSQPSSASSRLMTIYLFRIWDSGELVFEGIPCKRLSDNEIGLYDTVKKVLILPYYDTGSFVAGQEDDNADTIKRRFVTNNAKVAQEAEKVYLGSSLMLDNS